MSILPGEKLRYAETHFKFKLPWSLLYKPWPEILVDAPFQFVPGAKPLLWIVVRDAQRFPTLIEKMEIHFVGTEAETKHIPERFLDLQFHYILQLYKLLHIQTLLLLLLLCFHYIMQQTFLFVHLL